MEQLNVIWKMVSSNMCNDIRLDVGILFLKSFLLASFYWDGRFVETLFAMIFAMTAMESASIICSDVMDSKY